MANILTAFGKASDIDIRNQVATLEVVTIGNILGIQSKKAYNGVASTANFFGGIFGKKNLVNKIKPKEIDEQIKERVDELSCESREKLDRLLRNKLRERLDIKHSVSDEELSMELVDKAAKHMKVTDLLTPVEKIDAVFQRYSERIEELIRREYDKADSAKREEMLRKINQDLGTISDEQREQVCKALKAKEVTADTVMHVVKTTGITGLMMTGGSVFGSYILLSVVLHGVFTTLLGITLPFAVYTTSASLLSTITGPIGWAAFAAIGIWQYITGSSKVDGEICCQMIFTARFLNIKPFAPSDEDLPTWISPKDTSAIEAQKESDEIYARKEEEYRQKDKELRETNERCRKLEEKEKKAREDLAKEKVRADSAQCQLEDFYAENERVKLQMEKAREELIQAKQDKGASADKVEKLSLMYKQKTEEAAKAQKNYSDAKKIIEEFPAKEIRIKDVISQVEKDKENECSKEVIDRHNFEKAQKERNQDRKVRAKEFKRDILGWLNKDNQRTYSITDDFVNMAAMCNNNMQKALVKTMAQVKDSDNPRVIAGCDGIMLNGDLHLPVHGLGVQLIYTYDDREKKVQFKSYTDVSTLNELEKERRESNELREKVTRMRKEQDEFIAEREAENNSSNQMIHNGEIYECLLETLRTAKYEVDIMSPWISRGIIKEIRGLIGILVQRGVTIKIIYGIENSHDSAEQKESKKKRDAEQFIESLQRAYGSEYIRAEYFSSHSKLLICDDSYYVITSCNPLSNRGDCWEEIGEISKNPENLCAYRKKYFDF